MAATKCIKAFRRGQEVQLLFRQNVRMGKKCDLSDFDRGMIVSARQGGLSISETACHLIFMHKNPCRKWSEKQNHRVIEQFSGQECIVNERGQRKGQS